MEQGSQKRKIIQSWRMLLSVLDRFQSNSIKNKTDLYQLYGQLMDFVDFRRKYQYESEFSFRFKFNKFFTGELYLPYFVDPQCGDVGLKYTLQ